MPQSTLGYTKESIESEIGDYLGLGRGTNFDDEAWTARDQRDITSILKAGAVAFYYPAPLPGERTGYEWSFLRPIRQLPLVEGGRYVNLPDDFGGLLGTIKLVSSDRPAIEVEQNSEQGIGSMYFAEPDRTGQPLWCAVQPIPPQGEETGPRTRLYVFPAADTDYTLELQYYLLPDALTTSNPFHHGIAAHGETLRAACLAKAELYKDNSPGPMAANFAERLAASISMDRNMKAQKIGYIGDPTYDQPRWEEFRHRNTRVTYNGVTP